MKQFSATAVIDASAERIWAIMTNASAYTEFDPNVTGIDGQIVDGQKITVHTKISDRAFPVTVKMLEPGRMMMWYSSMPLGMFKGERTFTLTPISGNRTQFDVREQFTGWMLPIIGRTIPDLTETFEAHAQGLKQRAEAA